MKTLKFTNYDNCISYLFGLERAGIKYSLKNITLLLRQLGNPEKKFKSIHIAGTNGKGSVSSVLNSVLTEKGYSTGLYTSPHISHFRERIIVNGRYISKKFILEFTNRMYPFIEKIKPSFFEVTTAMSFDYFQYMKVDYAVVETGLGGRLDATNVLTPIVSVITSIGIDHVEFLGKSIIKISGEKAGIIKKNIPAVCGNVPEESKKVFIRAAGKNKSELIFAQDVYKVRSGKYGENKFYFSLKGKNRDIKNLVFPVTGDYQKNNIKTSFAVLDTLEKAEKIKFERKHIYEGIKNIRLNSNYYGRFELISKNPKIIIDVSHNLQGMENIRGNLSHIKYNGLIIIFGMMNDKQYKESINELFKLNTKKIIFTKPEYKRSAEPETLLNSVKKSRSGFEIKHDVKDAYKYAMSIADREDMILVTGSFFLVSDFLRIRGIKYRSIKK